jgi:hypothetical protein
MPIAMRPRYVSIIRTSFGKGWGSSTWDQVGIEASRDATWPRIMLRPNTRRKNCKVCLYVYLSGLYWQLIFSFISLKCDIHISTSRRAGRAVAQGVIRWLTTAAARVRFRAACGFVVDKAALGQVFSEYFCFPCKSLFHQFLHHHNHPGLAQ